MFSARLRAARKRKKLSQEELAKLVNTTKSTISNYENEYSTPSNDTLIKLSSILETTTDYLLGRTDQYSPTMQEENASAETEIDKYINYPHKRLKYKGRELTDEELIKVSKMLEVILDKTEE
jgi:transcriptional regulator with XRE-family HTH domain